MTTNTRPGLRFDPLVYALLVPVVGTLLRAASEELFGWGTFGARMVDLLIDPFFWLTEGLPLTVGAFLLNWWAIRHGVRLLWLFLVLVVLYQLMFELAGV